MATVNDLYTPKTLVGVVKSLIRPKTFFLERFFKQRINFQTKSVIFDVELKRRRVAAFASPLSKGRAVSEMGYRSTEMTPAYINETKFMRPLRSFNRAIGETIGGEGGDRPLSLLQRHMLRVSAESLEMVESVIRKKELMAAEVLLTGKSVITSDGVPNTVIDFGRDPALTITPIPSARWNQPGSDPLRDLQKWNEVGHRIEGVNIGVIVMDPDAFDAASNNEEFLRKLDNRNARLTGDGGFLIGPVSYAEGPVFHGMLGNLEIWTYSDYYEDPDTAELKPFLPSGTVLGLSESIQGVQLHGAILDEESGMQSMEFFANSWLERNPSGRMLQMQSAPLIAPFRPNGSYCATVL